MLELTYHTDRLIQLRTDKGEHWTRSVVLAVGVGAFSPKKLNLPDIDRLEGHGISYFVKEKEVFSGETVIIVGGGDSAVDWALMLKDGHSICMCGCLTACYRVRPEQVLK